MPPRTQGVMFTDRNGRVMELDKQTHALKIVEYAHHEIHDGNFYTVFDDQVLGNNAQFRGLFQVPNSPTACHMFIQVAGSTEGKLCFYEGTSYSNVGMPFTSRNHNRTFTDSSGITFSTTPTIVVTGTCIDEFHFGARQSGGGDRSNAEFVLNPDKEYLVIVMSESADNNVTFRGAWYESSFKVDPTGKLGG